MKIKEFMDRLSKTSNKEIGGLNDVVDLNLDDDNNIWGKRTDREDIIYKEWNSKIGDDLLDLTPFRDAEFLRTFLSDIPREEQFYYVYNTAMYCSKKGEYDPNYVLVTRRSLPRLEDKPEQFWTIDYINVMNGLNYEIPKNSAHRQHSVILVATLGSLNKYGFANNNGGHTDGEIMINNVPFSRDDILFVHKSNNELLDLISYIYNGGLSNDDVFEQLKNQISERQDYYNGRR